MIKIKTVFKKLIVCTVVIAVLFAVIPGVAVSAGETSKQMTTGIFASKLESFINTVYADGSKYVNNSELYRGIQCYGFANQLAKYFYGSFPVYDSTGRDPYPDWTVTYGSEALLDLHIGDVVRFRSSAGADHSIFVTGMDEEKIYFSDANNDHNNTVRHNAEMTWQKLIGKMDKTLQSNSKYIGWVAHYKYWDDDPDHAGVGTTLYFNANGKTISGEQTDVRYIVLDTLNMRSGPGLEYGRIAKMYDDTLFDVPCGAELVEADGYVWAPVTQGDKSGWSVINIEEWCKPVGAVMSSEYYVGEEDGIIYKTSDMKPLTLIVRDGAVLPEADALGLSADGEDFLGWSDSADGGPVSMESLLEEAHGEPLTLYALWGSEETEPLYDVPILAGDTNGDGILNNKDVVVLFNLVSQSSDPDPRVCDVNGDKTVDNKDIIYLFRIVSSFTGVPETDDDPLTDDQTTDPDISETEPDETDTADTEITDTETEPPETDTEPAVPDTEPADTDTDPAETETEPPETDTDTAVTGEEN